MVGAHNSAWLFQEYVESPTAVEDVQIMEVDRTLSEMKKLRIERYE